jgi:hypothetical protein
VINVGCVNTQNGFDLYRVSELTKSTTIYVVTPTTASSSKSYSPSVLDNSIRTIFPTSFDIFQQQLDRLKNLNDDWNGYGSAAPNYDAISTAQNIIDELREMDFVPENVASSSEGGVGISFLKGGKRALIECYNDGEIASITFEGEKEPTIWEISNGRLEIRNALDRIYEFINGPSSS